MSKDFHWRGGDVLKEKEYLTSEYKAALAEFRKISMIKENLEKEVNQANNELNETLGYTDALSAFIDGTQNSQKEQELKQKLDKLEQQIAERQQKLEEMSECQNPAALATLAKENAFLLVEAQRGSKSIQNAELQTNALKRQLAACTVSDQYQYSSNIETLIIRETKRKNALTKRVRQLKGNFDSSKKYSVSNSDYAQELRDSLTSSISLKHQMKDSNFNYKCEIDDHNTHIKSLISQIEELNQRLQELELEDYIVDVNDLNNRFAPKIAYSPTKEETEKRRKDKEQRHKELFEKDQEKRLEEEEKQRKEKRERDRKRREELEEAERKREEERRKDLEKFHERKRQEEEHRRKLISSGRITRRPAKTTSNKKDTSVSKPVKQKLVQNDFQDDETTQIDIGDDDDINEGNDSKPIEKEESVEVIEETKSQDQIEIEDFDE